MAAAGQKCCLDQEDGGKISSPPHERGDVPQSRGLVFGGGDREAGSRARRASAGPQPCEECPEGTDEEGTESKDERGRRSNCGNRAAEHRSAGEVGCAGTISYSLAELGQQLLGCQRQQQLIIGAVLQRIERVESRLAVIERTRQRKGQRESSEKGQRAGQGILRRSPPSLGKEGQRESSEGQRESSSGSQGGGNASVSVSVSDEVEIQEDEDEVCIPFEAEKPIKDEQQPCSQSREAMSLGFDDGTAEVEDADEASEWDDKSAGESLGQRSRRTWAELSQDDWPTLCSPFRQAVHEAKTVSRTQGTEAVINHEVPGGHG